MPGIKQRIVLFSESGELQLSPEERAKAREIEITHEQLREIKQPVADYLSVKPLAAEAPIPFGMDGKVSSSQMEHRPPYQCVKVSGKVTYEDGSPIPAQRIRIIFLSQAPPIDPKTPPKSGVAEADLKTGRFNAATTFSYKDGIIVGKHKVIVQVIGNGKLAADEYSDPAKTPLTVESEDSPFELKIRKPR